MVEFKIKPRMLVLSDNGMAVSRRFEVSIAIFSQCYKLGITKNSVLLGLSFNLLLYIQYSI